MRYFSTFSGIGGFELGIQLAYESLDNRSTGEKEQKIDTEQDSANTSSQHTRQSPTCIGYSEIDKYAATIYQKHFPYEQCELCATKGSEERGSQGDTQSDQGQGLLTTQGEDSSTENGQPSEHNRDFFNERQLTCQCRHKPYGDITTIDADALPDFDLLVGGFPCQAFSIAGKRGGFEDTRGTMFFELARILRAKQPRLFVFENVKGLLSHDGGKSFATIIQTLDELGYDCQWQVLNSKNHGVPQNRERVFIVGHLRGTPRPKVFPFGSSNETPNGDAEIRQLNQPRHSNDRVYGAEGISPTLNTMQGGNRQPFIVGGLQGHQIAKDDGIAPCLTTAMGQGGGQTPIVWSDDIKIRRLTPTECERLQGFPDGWTEGVSDTQRYKTLGNAVTVNVIRDIMEKLLSTPKEQI